MLEILPEPEPQLPQPRLQISESEPIILELYMLSANHTKICPYYSKIMPA